MKTIPILFSTEMVQALMEGRKTQTRRVVKFPKRAIAELACGEEITLTRMQDGYKEGTRPVWGNDDEPNWFSTPCPYGQPGDVLWVRETWKPGAWREDGRVAFDYRASPELTNTPWTYPENFEEYLIKWTDELMKNGSVPDENGFHHWEPGKSPLSWKPSIFMPKAAARLFLKITDVRVERLQDISEADAVADGIENVYQLDKDHEPYYLNYMYDGKTTAWDTLADNAIHSYKTLWQKINGAESWDANPWVWVVTFERCEKPENF